MDTPEEMAASRTAKEVLKPYLKRIEALEKRVKELESRPTNVSFGAIR